MHTKQLTGEGFDIGTIFCHSSGHDWSFGNANV